jgi:hypothetical protein
VLPELHETLNQFIGIQYARHRISVREKTWKSTKVDEAVAEYKRWWILKRIKGVDYFIPMLSDTVDTVWHAHILHTELYQQESIMLFGEFLHHEPILTPDPHATEKNLEHAIERFPVFSQLYLDTFGEPLGGIWEDALSFVASASPKHASASKG